MLIHGCAPCRRLQFWCQKWNCICQVILKFGLVWTQSLDPIETENTLTCQIILKFGLVWTQSIDPKETENTLICQVILKLGMVWDTLTRPYID